MGDETIAGLVLCDDMIFTSKIVGTARAHGLGMRSVATVARLFEQLDESVCGVVLDLHNPSLQIAETMMELRNQSHQLYVVGFGSHVDTATLQAARQAGCNLVLPRSKFVEDLEKELPRWLAPRSAQA